MGKDNGNRVKFGNGITTWLIGGLLGILVAINVGIVIDDTFFDSAPFEPLGEYILPQPVVNSGPFSISEGNAPEFLITKCNISNEEVSYISSSIYRRVSPEPQTFLPGFDLSITRESNSCSDEIVGPPLPDGITSGIWTIEGTDTVISKGKQQVIWQTEPFKVIP